MNVPIYDGRVKDPVALRKRLDRDKLVDVGARPFVQAMVLRQSSISTARPYDLIVSAIVDRSSGDVIGVYQMDSRGRVSGRCKHNSHWNAPIGRRATDDDFAAAARSSTPGVSAATDGAAGD